jgi:branched-chain amino acid transport system substrate-binding protein
MCVTILLATGQAYAAGDTIKVGMIGSMSGIFSDMGVHMTNGAKAYMEEHGDKVAGKKIELVIRDSTGANPAIAKRLAQELIVKDKVDFIAGLGFTPNALAVAQVITEAKTPTIIMNAATSVITTKSPYFARVSMTLPQITEPLAQWAYKSGLRKVYTLVADYGPGYDAEAAFKKAFTKLGGTIVGDSRVRTLRAAYQGQQAGGGVRLRHSRRDGGRIHEVLQRAWPCQGRHQADLHG